MSAVVLRCFLKEVAEDQSAAANISSIGKPMFAASDVDADLIETPVYSSGIPSFVTKSRSHLDRV